MTHIRKTEHKKPNYLKKYTFCTKQKYFKKYTWTRGIESVRKTFKRKKNKYKILRTFINLNRQ